jgi:hypothetical protein
VAGDIITFRCLPDEREDAVVLCARKLDPFRAGDRSTTEGAPLMLKLVLDQFMDPANDPVCPHEPGTVAFVEDHAALLLAGFEQDRLRPPTA